MEIIKAFQQLGSKIKMLFDNKHIEDAKLADGINSNLSEIKAAIYEAEKAINKKSDKSMLEALNQIKDDLNKKKLSVNVEAPIVNLPEPKIKVLKETKEAIKTNDLLDILIKICLRQLEENDVKITNSLPQEAIPVKLTDKSGKRFYDAIMQAITSNGIGRQVREPYNEYFTTSFSSGSSTPINYVLGTGKQLRLLGAYVVGTISANWQVQKNGTNILFSYGREYNVIQFPNDSYVFYNPSDTLRLILSHSNAAVQTFYGNLFGYLIDY